MTPLLHRWLPRLALLVALLPFLGLCLYNQPYWDDLSMAANARDLGIWPTQHLLRMTHGGRFVSMFLLTVANPLTYGWWHGVKITALICCIGTAATIWFGLRSLTRRQLSREQTGLATALLMLVYIAAIPDIHSSLYWFSGQVVHQLPMLLLVVVPVAVDRAHRPATLQRYGWLALAAAGTFIIGGSSELVIMQLGIFLALGMVLSIQRRQWHCLRIWGALLAVLAFTCLFHLTAPGNYARLANASAHSPVHLQALIAALGQCLRATLWQPTALLLLAIPLLFTPYASLLQRYRPAGLRLPLPFGAAVLLAGFVVGVVLMLVTLGGPPLLARATNVLLWWLLIGWCLACWAALPLLPAALTTMSSASRWVVGALLVVMTMAPVIRAWQELLVEAPGWARQCDARLPVYTAAAGRHNTLVVTPISGVVPRYVLVRGYDIQPNPGHPLNQATAQYFRLGSVRTGGAIRPAF